MKFREKYLAPLIIQQVVYWNQNSKVRIPKSPLCHTVKRNFEETSGPVGWQPTRGAVHLSIQQAFFI